MYGSTCVVKDKTQDTEPLGDGRMRGEIAQLGISERNQMLGCGVYPSDLGLQRYATHVMPAIA